MDLGGGGEGSEGGREGVSGAHTGWEEGREGKKARGKGGGKPEPCSSAPSHSGLLLSVLPQGRLM